MDVDGVLLNWKDNFDFWLENNMHPKDVELIKESKEKFNCISYAMHDRYGISEAEMIYYIKGFNQSIHFSHLLPIKNARKAMDKLVSNGWIISTISSYSDDPLVDELRKSNLDKFFKKTTFYRHHRVGLNESKTSFLKHYRNKYKKEHVCFVDDKPAHILDGIKCDIESYLFIQPHNKDHRLINSGYGTDWENFLERYK